MKVNRSTEKRFTTRTHEGAPARIPNAFEELKRAALTCMLWENQFYEEGHSIVKRMQDLIPHITPQDVESLAIKARNDFKLRHTPLLLVREMARYDSHKPYVANALERVIQRVDEIPEFLSIYWKDDTPPKQYRTVRLRNGRTVKQEIKSHAAQTIKKSPLSNQIKKGLSAAFNKFDEYQFAKYDRDLEVKLRDAMFLCHAKPADSSKRWTKDERRKVEKKRLRKPKLSDKSLLFEKIVTRTLTTPETHEVLISACGNDDKKKKKVWEDLLSENKVGALALLRNLRNFQQLGVSEKLVIGAMKRARVERVLPFRFITAARYAPNMERELEDMMFRCLESHEKLPGKTKLLIDVSGSMDGRISDKSELSRMDAACALAMLAAQICERVEILTFSHRTVSVPPRKGFALRDAVIHSQPHGSTYLGAAVKEANSSPHDRVIVFTDEQSHDAVPNSITEKAYMVNVASYDRTVGTQKWVRISGFSEAIIDFILEYERTYFSLPEKDEPTRPTYKTKNERTNTKTKDEPVKKTVTKKKTGSFTRKAVKKSPSSRTSKRK